MRVEVTGVTKRFGRVTALRDVSFALPAGRRVALIGPNGSGKSTLNRVILGLLACKGSVRLDGSSPFESRVDVARRMAYVPQVAPQLGASVGELLRTILTLRELEMRSIDKLAAHLELDLAPLMRRPFRVLSGGMKQKLLIALAFAAQTPLLLLDEPTGNLDARARERFVELFKTLPAETTLILCSHRLEEIRQLVDHVLLLEEGRLSYDGPAGNFLEACAVSVIEVWVEGESSASWLRERRFRPGAGGGWLRTATHDEKMKLLADLSNALGSTLRNVIVRDLETLDLRTREGIVRRG